MVNVLHLIDHYKIGGPGKTIINSAKLINRHEFNIYVSSFVPDKLRGTEFSKAVTDHGIPYLPLPDTRGFSLRAVRLLSQYIRDNKIAILHTHGYKTDFLGLIVKLLRHKLILVSTQHGWIRNKFRQRLYIRADLSLGKYFDGIVVVSQEMMRLIPNNGHVRKKVRVIHNAIVLDDYATRHEREIIRHSLGVTPQEILVGAVGRLSIEKGCLDLLDVFGDIAREHNDVKLIYIGEGSLLNELRTRIVSLGLQDKVILAGHRHPIQPFYEALDILVCPSHTEGLSNVILEAMASGVPIVATRVGGNSEIIQDRINGLLVPAENSGSLKTAILELAKKPDLRMALVTVGRETVRANFDFREKMKKIETFYRELLANHIGNHDRLETLNLS